MWFLIIWFYEIMVNGNIQFWTCIHLIMKTGLKYKYFMSIFLNCISLRTLRSVAKCLCEFGYWNHSIWFWSLHNLNSAICSRIIIRGNTAIIPPSPSAISGSEQIIFKLWIEISSRNVMKYFMKNLISWRRSNI